MDGCWRKSSESDKEANVGGELGENVGRQDERWEIVTNGVNYGDLRSEERQCWMNIR